MLIWASTFAIVIPMIAYVWGAKKLDIYESNYSLSTLKGYLYGAVGAVFFSIIFSLVFYKLVSTLFSDTFNFEKIDAILVAPIIEELTKGIFLFFIIKNKKVCSITEGMIIGGAIGLSFGLVENIFYFSLHSNSYSTLVSLVLYRTFFSAVMHCVSTGIMGAFFSYIKFFNSPTKYGFYFMGFLTAVVIHSTWNFCSNVNILLNLGYLFLIMTVVVFFATYVFAASQQKKYLWEELKQESESGLIPMQQIEFLNSKNKICCVDESKRKAYIKAVITLAFRKIQYKNAGINGKDILEKDINEYRTTVSKIISEISEV